MRPATSRGAGSADRAERRDECHERKFFRVAHRKPIGVAATLSAGKRLRRHKGIVEDVNWMNDAELIKSQAYCRAQAKAGSRSFYFASFALPKEKRIAAYSVYSFCRYIDDLVDNNPSGSGLSAVEWIQGNFDHIINQDHAELPFAFAFANAVKKYRIEKEPFIALTRGVLMDSGPVTFSNWQDLRRYCYHVASVVGLMMARIFELKDDSGLQQASDLGTAMQLTNILRDVKEDLERDRLYLPLDELKQFGVSRAQLEAGEVDRKFRELMKFQIARARHFYIRAEPAISLLQDDGSQFAVWVMRHVYSGILDEIERIDYDIFKHRVSTSPVRKMQLTSKALLDYSKNRRNRLRVN
ncbi:MAG: phytoene/squalene synthase family protein [Verrucomicrobia bacterium]|nr:phytoene/squalene synthase family protein [Verrucomicrobiota bacterium]MBV9673981.1 phytoene/squalene synthase family protein [Verrucomicrobiota bacterium]